MPSFAGHLVSIIVPTLIGRAISIAAIVLGVFFRAKVMALLGLNSDEEETVQGYDNPTYEKGPVAQGHSQGQGGMNGARSSGDVAFSDVQKTDQYA